MRMGFDLFHTEDQEIPKISIKADGTIYEVAIKQIGKF